jgi:hypothetical protein
MIAVWADRLHREHRYRCARWILSLPIWKPDLTEERLQDLLARAADGRRPSGDGTT